LATILVLVLLQVILVVSVICGARDQDLSFQRIDTVKSFYATDSVANMAMRELVQGVDESGDGGVGSIAAGVIANGPTINGAHAAASLSTTSTTATVTVKGSSAFCNRAIALNLLTQNTAVNPRMTYATSTATTTPVVRAWSSGAWGSAVSTSNTTADIAWEILKYSPETVSNPTLALVTLAQDASLACSIYSSGVWSSSTTLANTGTAATRVCAAEFEDNSGNLMVAYRNGSNTNIYYRTYTVPNPAEQSVSLGLASAPTWIEIVGKPSSNELLMLASAGSRLYAGVWNGTSWGNTTTLENSLPTSGRPFHAAYMNKAGKAIVVWTAMNGAPKYVTWDGSTWSSSASTPAIAGGAAAGWIKLAGSPIRSSNEILMAIIGTDNQISLNAWSGTAWGSNVVAETTGAASTQPRVDVNFQTNGSGLAVWYKNYVTTVQYCTYAGGVWAASQTGPDMLSESKAIHLERGFGSTELMMLVRRNGPIDFSTFNVYSQNGSIITGQGTTISGPTGTGGGYSLPLPPSATAGTTDLSVNGGTVAPGAYGALTTNGTVTLTAGTYVFTSMNIKGILNFDSSGGPITVDVTVGGFGTNGSAVTNTGGGSVLLNIIGGDLNFQNQAAVNNLDVVVYNGAATFWNKLTGSMNVYAKGDITFKNNTNVSPNGLVPPAPEIVSTVMWTAGVAGTRTDVCLSTVPAPYGDPCALGGSPMPGSPTLDSWAAVAWQ
jgi:hypothetical protein